MEQTRETYKVIIAGTRTFDDYALLCRKCDEILQEKVQTHTIVIISGTARGADRLGERYAQQRGYDLVRMPADWTTYGKRAGMIRNAQMAAAGNALIAFWDGQSKGTRNMIGQARSKGLSVHVVTG